MFPQALPSSLSKDSFRLVPKLLISRLHLPLAFLEPVKVDGDLDAVRLFSARIPILESQLSHKGNSNEPTVLIAGSDSSNNLYAVEKAGVGIYALCKLIAWVTLADLERSYLQCHTQTRIKHYERRTIPGSEWWHNAAIGGDRALGSNVSKKQNVKRLERIQVCLKPPLQEVPSATPTVEDISSAISHEQEPSILNNMIDEVLLPPLSKNADEIFVMLRLNYQEALYMSQVRSRFVCLINTHIDFSRFRWHILLKAPYLEPEHFSKVTLHRRLAISNYPNS